MNWEELRSLSGETLAALKRPENGDGSLSSAVTACQLALAVKALAAIGKILEERLPAEAQADANPDAPSEFISEFLIENGWDFSDGDWVKVWDGEPFRFSNPRGAVRMERHQRALRSERRAREEGDAEYIRGRGWSLDGTHWVKCWNGEDHAFRDPDEARRLEESWDKESASPPPDPRTSHVAHSVEPLEFGDEREAPALVRFPCITNPVADVIEFLRERVCKHRDSWEGGPSSALRHEAEALLAKLKGNE